MKISQFLLFAASLSLISCSEPTKESEGEKATSESDATETLDVMAKRHVESALEIPRTEKYQLKIYRAHLDGDTKEDAIITVNRLDFAIDEAIKGGNTAKRAELGYMGNYNYFFFYDAGLNKISPPFAVPSTPHKELSVSFENISSEAFKDIIIDFRIRNSSFKDFYTVNNHNPRRIFQWKNFDGLGSATSEAYHFKFNEGSVGLQKDILVYKAEIIQPKEKVDLNVFEPELLKSDELLYRFFYAPQMGKYATEKK